MIQRLQLGVAVAVLTGLVTAASPALGARVIKAQPARSWAVTYLGRWHVAAHPEYPKAVFALGTPSHVKNPDIPGCEATWKRLGLRSSSRASRSRGRAATGAPSRRSSRATVAGSAGELSGGCASATACASSSASTPARAASRAHACSSTSATRKSGTARSSRRSCAITRSRASACGWAAQASDAPLTRPAGRPPRGIV
jgi:hypothetical protein